MGLPVAFAGGLGNDCNSQMSKEEKSYFSKQRLWQNTDSLSEGGFCQKVFHAAFSTNLWQDFRKQQHLCIPPCLLITSLRRSGTTRAEILQNDASTSHDNIWGRTQKPRPWTAQSGLLQLEMAPLDCCFGSFHRETPLFSCAWCMRRCLYAGLWWLVFLLPPTLWLFAQSCAAKVCEAGGAVTVQPGNRWPRYASWQLHSAKHI